MPIYEYACTACGATLEVFQGMKDVPLTDCHACAKPALQKLISATGFRLKGDGWYATGYATGYETDLKKDNDKKKNLVDSNAPSTSTEPVSTAPNTSESANATASAANVSKTETSV